MSETEKQALARWVDEKEKHFNAHRKQFNLAAIILSVIDIALSIWTAYTVISVITSTVIAIVYGGRFWQLIKVEKLVKAVASGYFTYIKHKKEKSNTMKRILTNLKNNPLTIVLAIVLSAVVGLAGYSIARTGYGASFGEVFDKDAGYEIVAEIETTEAPETEVEDETEDEIVTLSIFYDEESGYYYDDEEGWAYDPATGDIYTSTTETETEGEITGGLTEDEEIIEPVENEEIEPTEPTEDEEIEVEETPAEVEIATYALTEPALIGAACFIAVFVLICWLGWDGVKAAIARRIAKKKGITVDELEKLSTEADADIAVVEAEEAKEIEEDVKRAEYEALVEEHKKELEHEKAVHDAEAWLRTYPTNK